MRIGLFCTYENPQGNDRSAYSQQTELVEMVEALGFDEAWVAEHHFNPGATSASPFVILSHLAARTSRIRLGSAAVLLPFRDPILVAEDIATVDLLSNGRFDLGIAKGGPFPAQNQHFHISGEQSRDRTIEALTFVQKLLYEDNVSFQGAFFKADHVTLIPKPLQQPIQTFFATSTPDAIRLAAEHDYGLMAAPPFPLTQVRDNIRLYRDFRPGTDHRLVLIRFYHLATTTEQAITEAKIFLQPFVERMQAVTAKVQPAWTPWMVIERIIADSLIGTEADVRSRIDAIHREIGPRSLVLKPLNPDFNKRKADLQVFAKRIRAADTA